MIPEETAKLLATISGVEPRFRRPDAMITAMWFEILQRIELPTALGAVADYYGRETDRVIMPADIVRFDRAQRQHRPELVGVHDRFAEIEARIERENARELVIEATSNA